MSAAFRIGMQLYGLDTAGRADLPGTLKALAAMGCQGIEGAPWCEGDLAGLDAARRAAGLAWVGLYLSQPADLLDPAHPRHAVLRTLGVRHAVAGWSSPAAPDQCAEIARLAAVLRDAGLTLNYHNHTQEFRLVEGRPALDILAETVPPALLAFELDPYFALRAGADPAAWIRRFAGRMSRLHVKDLDPRDQSVAIFGRGVLDAPAVLRAAADAGIEWLVIEFHPGLPDPLGMARQCIEGLRAALARAGLDGA